MMYYGPYIDNLRTFSLVQNEVTPPKQCEFRGLENLRMHGVKDRGPLEKSGVLEREMLKNTLLTGHLN